MTGHGPFRKAATLLAVVLLAATGGACSHVISPAKGDVPLADVDLQRVYGGWYIVSVMPNWMERGIVGSYDVFSPGPRPLSIHEDYTMQRGGFGAKKTHFSGDIINVMPNSGNADWRVGPFWPIRAPFQIVYVDPEYRFVLFGEQNRKWGWVYSRTQMVSDTDYAMLMGKFQDLGWDTSLFRKVIQTPDQVGAPGFWSDGVKRQ